MEPRFDTLTDMQNVLETTPLHRLLGFRIEAFDRDAGTLRLTAPADGNAARFDGAPQAHGGAIATLIDSCATFACSGVLGRPVPTMSIRVDYLRPASGAMRATATVRKLGRTAALIDVDVHADGKLVATGRCVQASGA